MGQSFLTSALFKIFQSLFLLIDIELIRYVATYATELIMQQRSTEALELFVRYGAPAKPQNLNIYRHLASSILLECCDDVKSLTGLRNIFQNLVNEIFCFPIAIYCNATSGQGSHFAVGRR